MQYHSSSRRRQSASSSTSNSLSHRARYAFAWLVAAGWIAACGALGSESEAGSRRAAQTAHRTEAQIKSWLQTHTFDGERYTVERLLTKRFPEVAADDCASESAPPDPTKTIAVAIPVTPANETPAVAAVVSTVRDMRRRGLIDELRVVVSDIGSPFVQGLQQAGFSLQDFVVAGGMKTLPRSALMGEALRTAVRKPVQSAIFAWIDPEGLDANQRYIVSLVGPLLDDDDQKLEFVKGFYEESVDPAGQLDENKRAVPNSGGRVTEITVRPLLNYLYPELAGFFQPMSGEFALRSRTLSRLRFLPRHAIQVGALIDVLQARNTNTNDLDAFAQVDLRSRTAPNPNMIELSQIAFGALDAILQRAVADQRLAFAGSKTLKLDATRTESIDLPNRAMLRLTPYIDPSSLDPSVSVLPFKPFKDASNHLLPGATEIIPSDQTIHGFQGPIEDFLVANSFHHASFLDPNVLKQIEVYQGAAQAQRDVWWKTFNDGTDVDLIERALAPVVSQKRKVKKTVTLVWPALNEGPTVRNLMYASMPLLDIGLLDKILFMDSSSTDNTVAEAHRGVDEYNRDRVARLNAKLAALGTAPSSQAARDDIQRRIAQPLTVDFATHQQLVPSMGARSGKGETLWKSLSVVDTDIVAWVDTDIKNPSPRFVYGVVAPLLYNDSIQFVKGYYERPIFQDGKLLPTGGGRVTELIARPLFNYVFPELGGLLQPLSGEFAGRTQAMRAIPFFTKYGVETSNLIDLVELYGMNAIAQCDLEKREHRNQSLASLAVMSFGILDVAMQRALMLERISFPGGFQPNRAMWRLEPVSATEIPADFPRFRVEGPIGPDPKRQWSKTHYPDEERIPMQRVLDEAPVAAENLPDDPSPADIAQNGDS